MQTAIAQSGRLTKSHSIDPLYGLSRPDRSYFGRPADNDQEDISINGDESQSASAVPEVDRSILAQMQLSNGGEFDHGPRASGGAAEGCL